MIEPDTLSNDGVVSTDLDNRVTGDVRAAALRARLEQVVRILDSGGSRDLARDIAQRALDSLREGER